MSDIIDELIGLRDYKNKDGSYNRLMDSKVEDMIEVKQTKDALPIESMDVLLKKAADYKASDIHISAGAPPKYRIDGKLKPLTAYEVMTPEVTKRILQEVMTSEQIEEFEKTGDLDFAIGRKDVGRFRK